MCLCVCLSPSVFSKHLQPLDIKMTADVEAMMSSRPQGCMKVEYTQAVDVSKRKVDLKGKFASKVSLG